MKDANMLFSEVCEEFGKVLPLIIRENVPTAYFDWDSITIPREFLEWDENNLKNVMRHEFGHLFFSPRDPAIGMAIYYIASIVGYPNPWIFVNFLADLIVDMTNMDIFGNSYLEFLEWSIGRIKNPSGVVLAMAGVYRRKAEELGLTTNLMEDNVGSLIYNILADETRDFYSRATEIALLLLQYDVELTQKMPDHFIIYIFTDTSNPIDFARAFVEVGMAPEKIFENYRINAVDSGREGMYLARNDPVMVEYFKMKAIAKYMDLENDLGPDNRQENIPGQWNIGDSLEELDVLSTVSQYGTIIPGVYSLKREPSILGMETSGDRYKDSIIILDCSSSMYGEKFNRAREAAYVILRKIHEQGGMVGFIPFSSEVYSKHTISPTREIWKITDILFRIHPHGGTLISAAIKTAISMGNGYHLYILSDAEVYDKHQAISLLSPIHNRCSFFLISDKLNIDRWFEVRGVNVVEISPDGLVKKVYEVVKQ